MGKGGSLVKNGKFPDRPNLINFPAGAVCMTTSKWHLRRGVEAKVQQINLAFKDSSNGRYAWASAALIYPIALAAAALLQLTFLVLGFQSKMYARAFQEDFSPFLLINHTSSGQHTT
eukprot:615072-Pelagomonas_calceolata.AAC.5